jgi:septal ring factor EnvC (AmiA/AmiB activator)
MKDVSALVTAIEYKLDLIMKQNKELKKQMLELKTKNESLTAKLQLKQEEKDELYKENQILLLNKGALRKQDSEKAKKNINDFIREIDKCIALLNE